MEEDKKKSAELVNYIYEKAINGIGPIASAELLAREYREDTRYATIQEKCESLVTWETTKNFTTGFLTGIGGLVTLPLSVPGALAASWIIQVRMAAAIAIMNGYNPADEKVKTMVLLTIAGGEIKNILLEAGVVVTSRLTTSLINQVPRAILYEINLLIGYRLISRSGATGIASIVKIVPFLGGAVTGSIDAYYCKTIGDKAIELFLNGNNSPVNNT